MCLDCAEPEIGSDVRGVIFEGADLPSPVCRFHRLQVLKSGDCTTSLMPGLQCEYCKVAPVSTGTPVWEYD